MKTAIVVLLLGITLAVAFRFRDEISQPFRSILSTPPPEDTKPFTELRYIPRNYTLFKQCDPKWANHRLGTGTLTICQAGCAMSSLSMILNTDKEHVNGKVTDPGTFNTWLTDHHGYVDGDLLVWAAADSLGKNKFQAYHHGAGSLSAASLRALVDKKQPVIVNVNNGGHWVLVVGYDKNDGTRFYVNDPGFNRDYYAYNGMSNFIVYKD